MSRPVMLPSEVELACQDYDRGVISDYSELVKRIEEAKEKEPPFICCVCHKEQPRSMHWGTFVGGHPYCERCFEHSQ